MKKKDKNLRKATYGSEVEFFDGSRWKSISEYRKGDKVLTYFWEDGHVELLEPLQYIKMNKKGLVEVEFGQMKFSTNMDSVYIGEYRSGGSDFYNEYNSLKVIYTLEEAMDGNFMVFSHIKMYTCFSYDSKYSSMLSEDKLRAMILGLVLGEVNGNECIIKIDNNGIKEHIRGCLKNSEISYKVNKCDEGYEIKYRLPRDRGLFLENPLMLSNQERNIVMDEISYICEDRRKIFVKDNKVRDYIQMVYELSNKRVTIHRDYISRKDKDYIIPERNTKVTPSKEKVQYSFTTRSGFFAIRNKGKIIIMGDYKK